MHFTFDTRKKIGFKHKGEVMHFTFDTGNFTFDTKIYASPLVTIDSFLANSISNIYYTNSSDSFAVNYYYFLNKFLLNKSNKNV